MCEPEFLQIAVFVFLYTLKNNSIQWETKITQLFHVW